MFLIVIATAMVVIVMTWEVKSIRNAVEKLRQKQKELRDSCIDLENQISDVRKER